MILPDTCPAAQLCPDLDQAVPGPLGLAHWCTLGRTHKVPHRCRCGWDVERGQEGAHPRAEVPA